jgi:glycosyltransferase involved in cell wall biosynthesis
MDRVLRIAGLAARLAGVKSVIPRRGSEFALKAHLNYRFHYRYVATGILVNSMATRETLCRDIRWQPAGKIHVLYNGLDLSPHENPRSRAQTRRELGIDDDAFVLINVGELTARKNAALLVRSMPAALEKRGDLHVLLVGTGPEAQPLRELAAECGVQDRLHLLGFRSDVADFLAASDVLVHCARVEGFGYAVAEAGAAGIPAVAARTSSIPEIIEDGVSGALFEDDLMGDLVRALEPYLHDRALRERHGQAGRLRVETEFELEKQMDKLEKIFQDERTG